MIDTDSLRLFAVTLVAVLACSQALSGMDVDEYLPPSQFQQLNPEEAREQHRRVMEEAARARAAAEQQANEERLERLRVEAELAARPLAVRLLEQRCLGCHSMELVTLRPRTRLGWEWVILRMQWINGAELAQGERGMIATHLFERHPAPKRRTFAELSAITLGALALLGLAWRRLRTRRHSHSTPMEKNYEDHARH